jgi:hypothetical protein
VPLLIRIIGAYFENNVKSVNMLFDQHAEIFTVEKGGTCVWNLVVLRGLTVLLFV